MKTNESGAGFGTIGRERSKLLTAVAVAAVVLACFAMMMPVDAEDSASEITYTEISPTDFLALDTDDDGVITLGDNYSLSGYVTVSEDLKVITDGHSLKAGGDMFAIGVDGIDFEIDASAGGTMSTEVTNARIIFGGGHEANITVTGGTYVSDWGFVLWGNNKVAGECDLVFTNATIKAGTVGMWLSYGAINSATITGCNVDSNMGIYLATIQSSVISGCTIDAITAGIEIKSGTAEIKDCIINSKNFVADDTVGMSQSGGSEAPITVNNGYCSSAQVTSVDVTISNTTVTCEAESYTPVVVTSYYESETKKNESPISITWEGASNSDVTFCPTQADATLTVNGFVAVDTAERLTAAVGNGSNVVLVNDIISSVEIGTTQNIIIDLNGFTLTNTDGSHTITNNGTLTVTDSSDEKDGTVDNTTHGKAALYNAVGATAILNGGTFERSTEAGVDSGNNGGNSYYTIQNQGTMTVNEGVSVENNGKFSSAFANGWQKGTTAPFVSGDSGERVTANLTINGGTFKGGLNTIKNDDLGVLTINGGLFTNYAQNAFMNAHIAVVNDGVFDANTEFSIYCYGADPDDGANEYIGDGKLTLNGGSFSGGIHMMGGSTLATDQDGIAMVSGNSITLEAGANLDGALAGPDGNAITITGFTASSKTTITAGSFVIDGSWIGSMTVSGDDIVVTGMLNEDANITVKPQADGTPTTITWRDFDQNGATIVYQDSEGNTAEPSEVSNQIYENAIINGVTIDTTYPEGGYVYDGEAQTLPTITVSVAQGQLAASGFLQTARPDSVGAYETADGNWYYIVLDIDDATVWHDNMTISTSEIIDAGAYSVKFGYAVGGVLNVVDCSWIVVPAEVTVSGTPEKTYDGTTEVVSEDITLPESIPGLTFGTPEYTDINAGDVSVRVPVTLIEGTVPGNYTFTVNGQDAQILGDAESGYYIELQGTISQKEITLSISADTEYSGGVFEHAYGLLTVTGVDGDYLTGTVVTSGSDAKAYSGADLTYSNIVIKNGETDVTENYVVTYDEDNTLTILPKKVTVSPAEGAEITKVYNGYSSRIMEDTDFQMTGVIEGDDVSFTWTNSSTYVKYNSSNVSDANTLTVTGITLAGADVKNYELTSDEVVFEDGVNGITVGITPLVLEFTGEDTAAVDKTYDGTATALAEDITSDDYTVSQSQSGTQPTVSVTSAVYDSADAGTGKTVYITGIELSNNDNGNFALPEMQTSDDISYYFSITGDGVKIDALAITSGMIGYDIAEVDGQIVLTLIVSYEDLVLTDFTSTLKLNETDVTGTSNSYPISSAGTYTATVTSTDSNWSGINVSRSDITVEFTYVANFYTKEAIDGEYSIEQTVSGDKQIQTPNATNVPSGYVLAGWALEPDGSKAYGVNVFADVSPVNTDFYAVYEKDDGTSVGPDPGAEPQVTIDMPSEFVLGEQTEFSVSTVANGYSGNVKGTGVFEGIQGVDYVIQYYEIQDGQWYDWTSGEFGPSDGFPMTDATSEFRVTFLNAGTYALTVQIVTADTGEVVCETTTTVDVVAAHSLDYHINAALDYQYTGDSEYEYKGDLSYGSGDIVAVYGPEYGEILQEIIGLIESGDYTNALAKVDELKDIKDDYVRYMGALHWQGTGVSSVAWNGTTYTWDDSLTMKGSRWTSENGTLSANINTYIIGQYLAGNFTLQISMELSNGAEREMFTYSVQFEEAPAPEVQYFDVTLSGEGVAFYVDGLRYDAGIYAFAEGEHRISIEVLHGYEGTPVINGGSVSGTFDVTAAMTITVTGVTAVVEPEPEYYSVTFKVDNSTSTVRVSAGDYIILTTPTKDGYTFDGWYVEGDESTLYNWYYVPTDDVVLVAKFTEVAAEEAKTYSVKFGEVRTYDGLEAGSVVTMPVVTPEENYRLIGWQTENGVTLTGQQYYVYAGDDADQDGTITLEPVFEKYVFTVTITGGENGTVGTTAVTVEMGGTAVITGVVADSGYYVESIAANGGYSVVDYGGTYIIFDVADDINVTVTFAADPGAQDITMTAALTEGGVVVNMSSNDGGNLPTGTIQIVYSYTEYNEDLGLDMTEFTTVELEYESVNQSSTQQTVDVTFLPTAEFAYAKFVVGEDDVRAQTGYFRTTMEI